MDGIENPSAELAALKAEFDELREQNADLRGEVQALKQHQPAQQPGAPTVGRRGLMAGGAGLLGLLAASGNAAGAADPSDGDADLGTNASPWDVWADGLALVAEDVSTSTTVTKPIVRYDSALSSITLTIDSSLEGPSGYGQPVWFLDQTGNADSNPVTVKASDGTTIATIPAANSIFSTVWDGSEWLTDRFIPTVDAGSADIGDLGNNGSDIPLSDILQTIKPSTSGIVQKIGAAATLYGSDGITLNDDATHTIEASQNVAGAILLVHNDSDNDNAVFTLAGTSITAQETDGSWATSDTDGNNCVFIDGSNNLILKNRLGSSKDYELTYLRMG